MPPSEQPMIEDLRNHSAETVDELRDLLASDAPLRADAGRSNFFEIDGVRQIFYVHRSPATGKVWLLATWPLDSNAEPLQPEEEQEAKVA